MLGKKLYINFNFLILLKDMMRYKLRIDINQKFERL